MVSKGCDEALHLRCPLNLPRRIHILQQLDTGIDYQIVESASLRRDGVQLLNSYRLAEITVDEGFKGGLLHRQGGSLKLINKARSLIGYKGWLVIRGHSAS